MIEQNSILMVSIYIILFTGISRISERPDLSERMACKQYIDSNHSRLHCFVSRAESSGAVKKPNQPSPSGNWYVGSNYSVIYTFAI